MCLRILSCLLLLFPLFARSGEACVEKFRLDILTSVPVTDVWGNGFTFFRNSGNGEITACRTLSAGEWESCEISFMPEREEQIRLLFSAFPQEKSKFPFVRCDQIAVTGAKYPVSSVETLRRDGTPLNWDGERLNFLFAPEAAYSGNILLRVSGANPAALRLVVEKGRRVTVKFYARAESPVQNAALEPEHFVTMPDSGEKILVSRGAVQFQPAFSGCGIYINPTEEERKSPVLPSCRVDYRERHEGLWRRAGTVTCFPDEKVWRGSLIGLKEKSLYEVRISVGGRIIYSSFRTGDPQVPVGETRKLEQINFFGGVYRIAESGSPRGYCRYEMEPNAKKGLVGFSDGPTIQINSARYVLIDGLVLDAPGAKHVLEINNSRHIILRNCRVTGAAGHEIKLFNCGDVLIEKSSFPHGIKVDQPRGGFVIRDNELGGIDGGLLRDSDVHDNRFTGSGWKMKAAGLNIRIFSNHFERGGIRLASRFPGPFYRFGNIEVLPEKEKTFGFDFSALLRNSFSEGFQKR